MYLEVDISICKVHVVNFVKSHHSLTKYMDENISNELWVEPFRVSSSQIGKELTGLPLHHMQTTHILFKLQF